MYQYKDHLGNNRLVYADCDGNGVIDPATEILEENNYYSFGLKHQGYNEIANSCRSEEAEQYKFLNKEYEDSFALNVTETDFRHYDAALGRFNVMDALGEIAYDLTPYRYGFNNPVFWQDRTGLFENWYEAIQFMLDNGFTGTIFRSEHSDNLVIAGSDEFKGRFWENFYETSYTPIEVGQGGGSSGGGSASGANNTSASNSTGSGSPNFVDRANWVVGTMGTGFEYTPGSFRVTNGAYNGNVFSPKYYASGWTGGSVARINTYNIAKIGKAVGNVGFAVGIATDIYGLSTGQTTWGKAGLNTGMSVYGMYVNPITGAMYGGLEAFYPGGTAGAIRDYSEAQAIYRQTNNGAVIKPGL